MQSDTPAYFGMHQWQHCRKATTGNTLRALPTSSLIWLLGLILTLFTLSASAQTNPARTSNGLIALYPFNEGKGTTVADKSGYGSPMNLKLYGAVSWNTNGTGVVFSGGRVGTGGSASKVINALRASNTSSFEAWVRPANTRQGGPSRLIAIAANPNQRNFLLGQEDRNVHVRLRHTGKNIDIPHLITSTDPLSTKLTHIVHTYDGSVEQLYINGVLQSTKVARSGAYSNWYAGHSLSIGNETTNDRSFAGIVEMVAIYDRALIATEVQQNYTAGSSQTTAIDTSPPSVPGSLNAQSHGTREVELTWIESYDDVGVASYRVYRNGTKIADTSETRYVDASANASTRYTYSVKAYDAAGNRSDSASITFTTMSNSISRTSSGLIAIYPFNEGSGSTAKDQSGSGSPMNLQLSGAVSWNKSGNGVIMNGGRVGTSSSASKIIKALRANNTSSFEAWVRPSNINQQGPSRLISIAASPTQRNYLLGQESDEIHVRLRHTGKTADKPYLITSNNALTSNLVHIVHTYDGNRERLYVNGTLQSAQVARSGAYSNWYTNHLLSIGNEAGNDRPFAGLIQMVAIYNRAIDIAEIQQNYTAGPSGQGIGGTDSGETGSSSSGSGTGTAPDTGTEPETGNSAVQLSWRIPTTRSTGEKLALSELDRYEIVVSPVSGGSSSIFTIKNPATTNYIISSLKPGFYRINMVSVDKQGWSSSPSGTVTVEVL